jgi:hypothetical protein
VTALLRPGIERILLAHLHLLCIADEFDIPCCIVIIVPGINSSPTLDAAWTLDAPGAGDGA